MRTFKVSGAVRPVAARRAPRAAVSAAQIRAIMEAPGLSRTARQAMIDAIFAGASVDLPRTHSPMPGVPVGGAAPRAHAESRPRMPGIKIGGSAAPAPRVQTPGRMPGLTLPVG